jgi:protein-S-isoprenylcysteine O-methyltransferase Ste14
MPFVVHQRNAAKAAEIDPRARWGLILLAVAYSLLWQGSFWKRSPGPWRVMAAALSFAAASAVCWAGVRALGRQWRIDAGVNPDHALVRSGIYAVIRHPIYCSMAFVFAGTALILTPWPLAAAAVIAFAAGTAIRVRIEDALLGRRFGPAFDDYRAHVPAFFPKLRLRSL